MENLTPVSQGTLGLSAAIFKLTQLGYTVSLPLNDNQTYDLVLDIDDSFLYKVDVKTSRVKSDSGFYTVQIRKVRSNKTSDTIHKFDNTCVDFLFIYTASNECYLIPCMDISVKNMLTLNASFDKYKV